MAQTEQTAVQEEQAAVPADPTKTQAQEAQFAKADSPEPRGGEEHLDMLLDIQLPVTVSLGKADIPLRRLLQMQPGSVLPLEKRIGEPVELVVQDVPFATGDIVIVDDRYAVRIRKILSSPAAVGIADESEKK